MQAIRLILMIAVCAALLGLVTAHRLVGEHGVPFIFAAAVLLLVFVLIIRADSGGGPDAD